jgi:ribosomal protein S18 acetylase RimI-like enzyme
MSIYLSAITLKPVSRCRELEAFLIRNRTYPQSICDSWALLDLHRFGLNVEEEGEWYVRDPSPAAALKQSELEVSRVSSEEELLEFERASLEGFEMMLDVAPLSLHAPPILNDPHMGVFIGRFQQRVVAVSMAYVSAGVLGIYGVATLPGYRRRGFGEVMTCTAIDFAPDLPAVLQPSQLGARLYRRLGFRSIGRFFRWSAQL